MNINRTNLMNFSVFTRKTKRSLSKHLLLLCIGMFLSSSPLLYAQCVDDFDCDNIVDAIDVDDDNDGILDDNENNCDGTVAAIPADAINSSIDQMALHDGSNTPQMIIYDFPVPGCPMASESVEYRVTAFPSAASGSTNICADANAFRAAVNSTGDIIQLGKLANCDGGLSYKIDFLSGDEILNLSSLSHGNMVVDEVIIIRSTVPLTAISYKKPGFTNVLGSNGGPTITGNGTTEVIIDNVSTNFGGNRNVWEVSSNGAFVPYVELEYYRSAGSLGASFEAFTLQHVSDCDFDCDGTPNRLDIDSDEDTCSDATEAGHTDPDGDGQIGTAPLQVDSDGAVIGQGGYTGNSLAVTDNTIASCNPCLSNPTDSDLDGICDLLDEDDDNDGITDINENNCAGTVSPIPAEAINNSIDPIALHDGSGTSQMINYDFPVPGCSTATDAIQYQVTATASAASGTNNICNGVSAFTSNASSTGDVIVLHKSANCDGGLSYRVDFLSGDEILNLSSLSHGNMVVDEVIIVRSTVPLTATTYKKPGLTNIPGTNGGPTITGNGTTEVIIDNKSTNFGGSRNVWEVSSNGQSVPYLELEYYRGSGGLGASFEAFTLNHVSECDNDCDGIANQLDTDSDDDGCGDAIEAGHMDGDMDGVLGTSPVMVDASGLVINQGGYIGNNDNVLDNTINGCDPCSGEVDTDLDGVCDLLDLDDDNDGITDVNENNCAGTVSPIPAEAINNSIDPVALHDGSGTSQMINYDFPVPGCSTATDAIQYQVTASASAASGTNNICNGVSAFTSNASSTGDVIVLHKSANCDGGLSYRVDFLSGDEILNLSSLSHGNMVVDEVIIVRSTVPLTATTYKKPGLTNIPGTNGGPTITGNGTTEVIIDNKSTNFGGSRNVWEVNSNGQSVPYLELEYYRGSGGLGASFEAFTLNHVSECDNDCDGIANQLDTDSDDDGCGDAIEAGHMDGDMDGVLGTSPVMVDENGLVLNQGGYMGNNDAVVTVGPDADGDGISDACDETCETPTLDNIGIADGNCQQNDGAIYLSISNEYLPHTFAWSNGYTEEDLMDAEPGVYSVVVTTVDGCTIEFGPFTIDDPCDDIPCIYKPKLLDAQITDTSCGEDNGAIDISVVGEDPPFTYYWTDGFATTEDVDHLSAGTYGVVVTDSEGCSVKLGPFVVGGATTELNDVNIARSNCGQATGGIYLSIENANFPHTFEWSNGSTDEDLLNVGSGVYSVTMTDGNGCEQVFGPYSVPDNCNGFDAALDGTSTSTKALQVFPNPILQGQNLTVKFYSSSEEVLIEISDVLGRNVKRFTVNANLEWNQIDLDVADLAKGVYYLNVNAGSDPQSFSVH